jgi:2-iminobutanoate/2-iminopropanoate deaminase
VSKVERLAAGGGWSFSEAVCIEDPGRWIHVAGQVASDPAAGMPEVTGDMESQANAIFDRIESHLSHFGGSLSHVVRITAFMTSFDEYGAFSRVRAERFEGNLPASAAMHVAGLLLNASLEVEAVAFIPDSE